MSKKQAGAPSTTPPSDEEARLAEEAKTDVQLVRMTRDPEFYSSPHEAEVHPDEVGNYADGGWVPAE